MMMATGTRPSQIVSLVLLETFMLELIGIVMGAGLGYLIVLYFQHTGIRFEGAEDAFAQAFMSSVTYPELKWVRVINSVGTLLAVTALAALYPAWKVSRMEPVKAIYHSY